MPPIRAILCGRQDWRQIRRQAQQHLVFDRQIGLGLLWPKLGVAHPPPGAYDSLLLAWREPQRRYHTLEHLDECLSAFEEIETLAEQPGEIELALWYHDAVHDTASDTN